MCGRYELNATAAELAHHFAGVLPPGAGFPEFSSYNIAPSLECPVIRYSRRDGINVVERLTWGFEPQWTERAWINARDDRLFSAPTFRGAAAKRRCLVIATGWYEWQARTRGKQPYYAHLEKRRPLAFAGVWTAKKNSAGRWKLYEKQLAPLREALGDLVHD